MMSGKLSELRSFLKSERLDAFAVLTKHNRQYLSGFTGSSGLLLVGRDLGWLFVDGRYTLRAKKESRLPVFSIEQLAAFLAKRRIKRIGIEDRISLRELSGLKRKLKRASFSVTSNVVENLRAVKTGEELASVSRGSQLIDRAFRMVVKLIRRRNITESEVAYRIEQFGKSRGAALAFEPIVAWGANGASPHHFSGNTKIGRNNFLLLDFGFKISGYHSDFTRTVFLGKPNRLQEKVYNIVLVAEAAALNQIFPGQQASLVDQTARELISGHGFGDKFTHNTGHGVGLEIHEQPNFSPDSADILRPNMVVTVEPGIYLPGKFGVRIEDMVLVGPAPEIFSKIPKSFKAMVL